MESKEITVGEFKKLLADDITLEIRDGVGRTLVETYRVDNDYYDNFIVVYVGFTTEEGWDSNETELRIFVLTVPIK